MNDTALANGFVTFVDDTRTIGQTKQQCDNVTRQVGSRISYQGRQDAPRKRRDASQEPGPWTGRVVKVTLSTNTVEVSSTTAK